MWAVCLYWYWLKQCGTWEQCICVYVFVHVYCIWKLVGSKMAACSDILMCFFACVNIVCVCVCLSVRVFDWGFIVWAHFCMHFSHVVWAISTLFLADYVGQDLWAVRTVKNCFCCLWKPTHFLTKTLIFAMEENTTMLPQTFFCIGVKVLNLWCLAIFPVSFWVLLLFILT